MKRMKFSENALQYMGECGTRPGCNDWVDYQKNTLHIGKETIKVCPVCLMTARWITKADKKALRKG